MLSLGRPTENQLAKAIAHNFRDARLARKWTRAELGARAGIAVPTLRKFEDSGQISLLRLLRLARALDLMEVIAELATPRSEFNTLADYEKISARPTRKRGRTLKSRHS